MPCHLARGAKTRVVPERFLNPGNGPYPKYDNPRTPQGGEDGKNLATGHAFSLTLSVRLGAGRLGPSAPSDKAGQTYTYTSPEDHAQRPTPPSNTATEHPHHRRPAPPSYEACIRRITDLIPVACSRRAR